MWRRCHRICGGFVTKSYSSRGSERHFNFAAWQRSLQDAAKEASGPAAAAGAAAVEGRGSGWVQWYIQQLHQRPVTTKSLTAAGIFTAADIVSQTMTHYLASTDSSSSSSSSSSEQASPTALITASSATDEATEVAAASPAFYLDTNRTLRMAFIGLVFSGPSLHLWFNFVARVMPSTSIQSTLTKMALGQMVYGPAFNATFFSFNAALQGETRAEIAARLKRDLLPTMMNGLLYWPACDFCTYRYVPTHMQGSLASLPHSPPPLLATQRVAALQHTPSSYSQHWLGNRALHTRLFPSPPALPSPPCHNHMPPLLPPWTGVASQQRTFVQLKTMLKVADNSGAKSVQCIKVLKGPRKNAAGMGDIIIASVKDALPRGKVKKGDVVTCVVVRAAMPSLRSDGSQVRFDGPAAVIINKAGEPIGTRVFGPVPHELRQRNLVKILTLAQLVV